MAKRSGRGPTNVITKGLPPGWILTIDRKLAGYRVLGWCDPDPSASPLDGFTPRRFSYWAFTARRAEALGRTAAAQAAVTA